MSNKSGGATPDDSWTIVFALICIFIVVALFWYFCRGPILEGLRWLRYGETVLIMPFSDKAMDACRHWLTLSRLDDQAPSGDIIRYTQDCFGAGVLAQAGNYDYYGLTGFSIAAIEIKIAQYYRWPVVLGFAVLVLYIMYFSPHMKFRTTHTLETFIKAQAKMWPVIMPIVNFNPIKSHRVPGAMVPDKLPPFAEALSPEEWISWHRIPVTNGVPDREASRRAFLLQLGPRWKGFGSLPPYMLALIAAFALKGVQKRDESEVLLGKIALAWTPAGGFRPTAEVMGEVKRIIRDAEIGGKAAEIADQHAYRTTAILGVLKWARWQGGVLAPAQFIWLRALDRTLWYALNNLGRRTFHIEGAGAIAHFMAEQSAKKPLPIARIDTAVVTLNMFLSNPEKPPMPIPPREGDKRKRS